MNTIDRIKEPYDRLKKMRDDQTELAKTAIQQGKAFAGVWMPTDTKLFLVTEDYLKEIDNEHD